jgi:photosystem II stability/assembly factor-like uncharacterized protein
VTASQSTLERQTEAAVPQPAEVLFKEARRRRHRRWGIGITALVVAVAAAVLANGAAGNSAPPKKPSSSRDPGVPAAIRTTWRSDGTTVFEHSGAGNYSGFSPTTTITCAGPAARSCYVTVHANGVLPDGRLSTPGTWGASATAFVSSEFASTDKGGTWRPITLPDKAWTSTAFSCPASRTCAVGALVGAKNEPNAFIRPAAVVLTTYDGGRSWALHRLPASAGLVRGLDCLTPETCVVETWTPTATRIDTMLPNVGAGRLFPTELYVTHSAGASWEAVQVPRLSVHDVYTFGALACPTVERCVLTGTSSHVEAVPGGYTASRHAQTYRVSSSRPLIVTLNARTRLATVDRHPSGPALTFRTSLALSCGTPTHCLMLVYSVRGPRAFMSTSGGRTWESVSAHVVPTASPSLACISAESCITSTGAVTNDGGKRWTLPNTALSAVSCSTSGTCVGLEPSRVYDPHVPAGATSTVGATRVVTNAPR